MSNGAEIYHLIGKALFSAWTISPKTNKNSLHLVQSFRNEAVFTELGLSSTMGIKHLS